MAISILPPTPINKDLRKAVILPIMGKHQHWLDAAYIGA